MRSDKRLWTTSPVMAALLLLMPLHLHGDDDSGKTREAQLVCSQGVCAVHGTSVVPIPKGMQRATVHLKMRSGRVFLQGGSSNLLEANYDPSYEAPPPVIHVKRDNGKAQVEVEGQAMFNRWQVVLSSDVLTTLDIDTRAADAHLDFKGSPLGGVDVTSGGGETIVELRGRYPYLQEMMIRQLNGEIVMNLPGTFPSLQKINLRATVGDITLLMPGVYPDIARIDLASTHGNIDLNLSNGALAQDLVITVLTATGNTQIDLPYESDVTLSFTTVTGRISAPGLKLVSEHHPRPNQYVFMSDNGYPTRIHVDIKASAGNVNVNYSK